MTIHRAFVENGGLMGYYPTPFEFRRRLGAIAAKVVIGVAAGSIPMEYISRNDLVLNERTASALGIEIPPVIRLQATEVFA
jgi:putative ABC transport system substrate-binding protein